MEIVRRWRSLKGLVIDWLAGYGEEILEFRSCSAMAGSRWLVKVARGLCSFMGSRILFWHFLLLGPMPLELNCMSIHLLSSTFYL